MFNCLSGRWRALVLAACAATLLPQSIAHSSETLGSSTLSGWVYVDRNNDGILAFNNDPNPELAISGVEITLFKTDSGSDVEMGKKTTDSGGSYSFGGLGAGTYKVRQTQPVAYVDGKETVGTFWPPGSGGSVGTVSQNELLNIVLPTTQVWALGYNFGELGLTPGYVSKRFLLASSPDLPLIPNNTVPEPTSAVLGLLAVLGWAGCRRSHN
jgi:hypothetical protein